MKVKDMVKKLLAEDQEAELEVVGAYASRGEILNITTDERSTVIIESDIMSG